MGGGGIRLAGDAAAAAIGLNEAAAPSRRQSPMRTPLSLLWSAAALAVALSSFASSALPAQQSTEARYARQLDSLRSNLKVRAPKVRAKSQQAFLAARDAEKKAKAALEDAKKGLGEVGTCKALVAHAKGKWIGGADRGIKKANDMLEKAKTAADRKKAETELAKWQANRKDGEQALKERQANLDKALRNQPKLEKAVKRAEARLERAQANTVMALKRLGLTNKLANNKLDGDLAKFVVMSEATPRGLAAFAGQGATQQQLIDRLLNDQALMLQMVVADGAKGGAYGRAMEIYDKIQQERPAAREGALQRLAVAIALEHAQPIKQRNATGATGSAAEVDPFARFCHYEKAFTENQLDPCFGQLTVWDLRMVVDGEEPDDVLAWGRDMLRSYRPDHVYTKDERWRYVGAVRTDIRYGSQDNKHDRSDLQFFQNILMNGGVCGRRAFFGRFMLRAFGVPTTARPQRGHAALVHWTTKGWVPCLGAGWGSGWTKTRYNKDLDFLATTQARRDAKRYLEVKRAQWLGDVFGEKPVYGLLSGTPGFWYGVSLYRQRQIIESSNAKALDAVGTELGEAEDVRNRYHVEAANVTEEDRRIAIDQNGTITIPAVGCSQPRKSGGKVVFLPCNLGGKQLHYSRNGRGKDLEYTFDVATAGSYQLTLQVASPSWQQHLHVSTNGGKSQDLLLPHTIGLWGETDAIEVELVAGTNVLRLKHTSDGYAKGFSLRRLRLIPKK